MNKDGTLMKGRIIKTLLSADGHRRVQIYERVDGLFSFVEEKWYLPELGDACWVAVPPGRSSLCSSADDAEREARGRIRWLSS